MLCEFCKRNEAIVHLIKVVNGKTERLNLCINCLKEVDILQSDELLSDLNAILEKILQIDIKVSDKKQEGKIFNSTVNFNDFLPVNDKGNDLANNSNKKCSVCGFDLKTIKATGKVGCENCYNVFRTDLTPILNKIHAGTKHIGKIPIKTSKAAKLVKEIRDLEYKLKQEIMVENFEEAAKLRDTIKKLKKRLSIGKK